MDVYEVRTLTDLYSGDQIQVPDDSVPITGEFRGAHRIAAAFLVPVEEQYECGVNDCSRAVDEPEAVCWQHSDTE